MENKIINRMQNRIMKHQKENGFETIFDFLNEDLDDLSKYYSEPKEKTSLADIEIKHDKGIDGYQPNDKLDTSKPPNKETEINYYKFLNDFLTFVDKKTHWKEINDVTNSQVINEWLFNKENHPLNKIKEKKLTRIEVIDDQNRKYVNWKEDNEIKLSYQDDNRTLKIFITKKETSWCECLHPNNIDGWYCSCGKQIKL